MAAASTNFSRDRSAPVHTDESDAPASSAKATDDAMADKDASVATDAPARTATSALTDGETATDASPWHAHFDALARYHRWATVRLFEHVDRLSEDDYRRDVGLFFHSVHGTLNHLLVAEHALWFPRFADGISNRIALDAELETDRAALRERLLAGVSRWQPLIAGWSAARFDGRLDYTTTRGVDQSLPFALTLAHVFNHGTHHRGQITAAITAMGHACPELDLVWMLQAESRQP